MSSPEVSPKIQTIPSSHVSILELEPPLFGNPYKPEERSKRITDRLGELLPNELLLIAGEFACFGSGVEISAEFEQYQAFSRGRDLSKQGVYFGEMRVGSDTDVEIATHVASKPYDDRKVNFGMNITVPGIVTQEWAMSAFLNRLLSGSAYVPVGFWRTSDPDHLVPQMLTRYVENSTSLDTAFRVDPSGNVPQSTMRAKKSLLNASYGLGILHGAGITHGDAYPQNIAVTGGSRIVFNDTTTMLPFSKKRNDNAFKVEKDVRDLFAGVFHIDASSEGMRELTAEILQGESLQRNLYEIYMNGSKVAENRLGQVREEPLIVGNVEFQGIIKRAVDKYLSGYTAISHATPIRVPHPPR